MSIARRFGTGSHVFDLDIYAELEYRCYRYNTFSLVKGCYSKPFCYAERNNNVVLIKFLLWISSDLYSVLGNYIGCI